MSAICEKSQYAKKINMARGGPPRWLAPPVHALSPCHMPCVERMAHPRKSPRLQSRAAPICAGGGACLWGANGVRGRREGTAVCIVYGVPAGHPAWAGGMGASELRRIARAGGSIVVNLAEQLTAVATAPAHGGTPHVKKCIEATRAASTATSSLNTTPMALRGKWHCGHCSNSGTHSLNPHPAG